MTDTLTQMRRYLQANPGAVLMLVLESYVNDASLKQAFDATDTTRYAETLHRGEPLPTLGELVSSGKRMVVFTEDEPDGSVPWLSSAFAWIQDTPLGNRNAADFTCRRYRGGADSPMLMLNNWVERFPPSPSAQRPVLTKAFLTEADRPVREGARHARDRRGRGLLRRRRPRRGRLRPQPTAGVLRGPRPRSTPRPRTRRPPARPARTGRPACAARSPWRPASARTRRSAPSTPRSPRSTRTPAAWRRWSARRRPRPRRPRGRPATTSRSAAARRRRSARRDRSSPARGR